MTNEQSASPEAAAAGTPSGTLLGAEDPAADPAATPTNEFHGAPADEASYEAFTLPDGYSADEELSGEFSQAARELNLNQKGAQRMVDLASKLVQKQVSQWATHVKGLADSARTDPDIGGAKFEPTVKAARGVITRFGNPAFRSMLDQYGVGSHPEMIRFLSKIGASLSETPAVTGQTAAAVSKSLPDLMYPTMETKGQ